MNPTRQFLALLLLVAIIFSSVAALADQSAKLVIGVIPEINLVRQMDRYVPLGEYLEKKIGLVVEIKPLSNYGQLFEEMRDGKIDAGFFGSLVYGISRAQIGIIPLARPVQLDGKSTYTGLLFVRKDAGIRKPADMKGRTIALVDPATSAGYLAQREYFADHGINMDKDLKIYWAGSHEAAVRAVLNHNAEIGGAKNTVVATFRKSNRTFDVITDIIAEKPKKGLPENTFAVRKGLDSEIRERLRKALLTMNRDDEGKNVLAKFGSLRFIATSDTDFTAMYEWARHLKIDLKSYQYKKQGL